MSKEYHLIASRDDALYHHLMVFGRTQKLSDLTPPYRLRRARAPLKGDAYDAALKAMEKNASQNQNETVHETDSPIILSTGEVFDMKSVAPFSVPVNIQAVAKAAGRPFPASATAAINKRKNQMTREIHLANDEIRALRERESQPWLLDGATDGNRGSIESKGSRFTGRLEGGQRANYVLFINQGKDFKVVPAENWYKFVPKMTYQTLSLEEAEAEMAQKRRQQWFGIKKENGTSHEEEEQDLVALLGPDAKRKLASVPVRSLRVTDSTPNANKSDEDDNFFGLHETNETIDYEDVFDDDEGAELLQEDLEKPLEETNLTNKNQSTTTHALPLTEKGKQIRELVRKSDRFIEDLYASDDEEHDPYAELLGSASSGSSSSSAPEESDLETEKNEKKEQEGDQESVHSSDADADERKQVKKQLVKVKQEKKENIISTTLPPGRHTAASLAARGSNIFPSSSSSTPVSSHRAPPSQTSLPDSLYSAKRQRLTATPTASPLTHDATLIPRSLVIDFLTPGKQKAKDLIALAKPWFKKDERNKTRFHALLKEVARMVDVDGEKWLELKK